jgi:phosphoketolase
LSDPDFDELFTNDNPVIFAFHAYPWLIHRLSYRRTNHHIGPQLVFGLLWQGMGIGD